MGGDDDDAYGAGAIPGHQKAGDVTLVGKVFKLLHQHVHYAYRGPSFADFNYLEYCCCVTIVPYKIPAGGLPEGVPPPVPYKEGGTGRAGRPANFSAAFEPDHPAYTTHYQQHRSDLHCPMLAGTAPPTFLGFKHTDDSLAARRTRDAVGAYYLTLLVPWDLQLQAPALDLTWASFVKWVHYDDPRTDPRHIETASVLELVAITPGTACTAFTARRCTVGLSKPGGCGAATLQLW